MVMLRWLHVGECKFTSHAMAARAASPHVRQDPLGTGYRQAAVPTSKTSTSIHQQAPDCVQEAILDPLQPLLRRFQHLLVTRQRQFIPCQNTTLSSTHISFLRGRLASHESALHPNLPLSGAFSAAGHSVLRPMLYLDGAPE